MKLYEFDEQLLSLIDDETGEIADYDLFEQLEMDKEKKIEGIFLAIKNFRSDAKQMKEEEDNLKERRRVLENKAENMSRFIEGYLNGEKFSTPRVSVSYRKSTSVQVDDLTKIPEFYLRMKEPEVDKTKVKDAIKNGLTVNGCQLVEKTSMIIK